MGNLEVWCVWSEMEEQRQAEVMETGYYIPISTSQKREGREAEVMEMGYYILIKYFTEEESAGGGQGVEKARGCMDGCLPHLLHGVAWTVVLQ